MRWGSVWLVVGIAQIATCAPVSLVLKERVDIFSDNLNGPVTILRTRSTKHISTEISVRRVNRNKLSQSPFEIISPPNRPIDPVSLPPLSKHGNSKLPSLEHKPAAWEQLDVPGDELVLEVPDADAEATFESFARPGMPCHNALQPQERNDMLIIYLAASFLLVVVTVESLGSYKRRRRGAIRLGEQNTSSQPPSIRADPELVEFLDEKQAVGQ